MKWHIHAVLVLGVALAGCETAPDPATPREPGGIVNASSPAGAPANAAYDFEPFDVPAELGNYTSVYGINNSGVMVGNFLSVDGSIHGFLYKRGHFIDVAIPGAGDEDRGALGDLNDAGTALGAFFDPDGGPHMFLRSPTGKITLLPDIAPGVFVADGTGINNAGTVVGTYIDVAGTDGFILRSGAYETFDYPGARRTRLGQINNHGLITGFWADSAGSAHGFVLDHGNVEAVAVPGAVSTRVTGINDDGDATGFYNGADGVFHGFLYSHGVFSTLDYPGSTDSAVFGINGHGVIVGTYNEFSFGMVAAPAVP
jgi:uncharacterized membrane protein